MKIVILSDTFPQSADSYQEIDFNLARQFASFHHEVHIITPTKNKFEEKIYFDPINKFTVHTFYIQAEKWCSTKWRVIYNPTAIRKIKQILTAINPEAIYAHKINRCASFYILKIARVITPHVFYTAHDVMSFGNPNLEKAKSLNQWRSIKYYLPFKHSSLVKYILNKNVKKIITVSKNLESILNNAGIRNTRTIYNGVDLDFWSKPLQIKENKNKITILYVGLLDVEKSVNRILDAVKIVSQQIDVDLILAGEIKSSTYKKFIMEYMNENDFSISLTGRIGANDLRKLYKKAHVTITFSILNPYSMVALESIAAGTPVVWGCRSGADEIQTIYKEFGYVKKIEDIHEIATVINVLTQNQEVRSEVLAFYKIMKKDFSIERQAREYLSLL